MRDIDEARRVVASAASSGRAALAESEAKRVLSAFGLDIPRSAFVPAGHAVDSALVGLRLPVVVKVASQAILHKTEVGGVRLGLGSADAVEAAIDEMGRRIAALGHPVEGWLVEEMVARGPEIVIGATVDPSFGPTVMVGLGGILVELIEDVSFRLCPIYERDAIDMLDELRGVKLLRGWRGAPPMDEGAVWRALLRIGGENGLIMSLSEVIKELDINPLIVSERGAVAADARIILKDELP